MKIVRWTLKALANVVDREIERSVVELTIAEPEASATGHHGRIILMRRYFDELLQQEMLLRVVADEEDAGLVILSIYKTSRVEKYLKGSSG